MSDSTGLLLKYFVLKQSAKTPYGHASIIACLAYADAIEPHNQLLAAELRQWMESVAKDEPEET